MAKYCPQCNAELPDDALFCTACGAPVGDDGAGPQGGSDGFDGGDYDYGDGGGNKRQLYILLGVVGVLAVLVAAVWGYGVYSEKRAARLAREKFVRDSIESVRRDSLAAVQAAERRRQDSIEWERGRIDRIKAAYKAKIRGCDNIGLGYFLYDISGDGIPELWIQVGQASFEMHLEAYIYEDETLRKIYDIGAARHMFYAGKNYVLTVVGLWGGEEWYKLTYDGNEITDELIYTGDYQELINGEWVEKEVKEPTEPEIDYIKATNLAPIDRMKIKERHANKSNVGIPREETIKFEDL